ncbi:MAG: hypothetical protein OXM02_13210 [Bacteroidota bacterium]|nr:hypothetical protein [Bacteroidota bacterium]
MESTPISRQEQYAIRNNGFGWHQVFDYQLLSTDELADLSAPEIRQELVRRLEEFMDSAEYRRIEDYFRCLAFRPDIPT